MNNQSALAYASGFFDGEGCIYIGKIQKKDRKSPMYVLQVTTTQKYREPLDAIRNYFDGVGHVKLNSGSMVWKWVVTGKEAEKFLKGIQKYSIVKRPQIDIALKFISMRSIPYRNRKSDYVVEYEKMSNELKRLKHSYNDL